MTVPEAGDVFTVKLRVADPPTVEVSWAVYVPSPLSLVVLILPKELAIVTASR
jgi:hypothetical protein